MAFKKENESLKDLLDGLIISPSKKNLLESKRVGIEFKD